MRPFLLILAFVGSFPTTLATRTADVVEYNHVHDGRGKHQFDQVIFWQWLSADDGHFCDGWALIRKPSTLAVTKRSSGYVVTWVSGGQLCRVRCGGWRETWTQHDPEIEDRQRRPRDGRSRWPE